MLIAWFLKWHHWIFVFMVISLTVQVVQFIPGSYLHFSRSCPFCSSQDALPTRRLVIAISHKLLHYYSVPVSWICLFSSCNLTLLDYILNLTPIYLFYTDSDDGFSLSLNLVARLASQETSRLRCLWKILPSTLMVANLIPVSFLFLDEFLKKFQHFLFILLFWRDI